MRVFVLLVVVIFHQLSLDSCAQVVKESHTLVSKGPVVPALAFSPNGQTLAAGGMDSRVTLWDVPTGRERKILKGHSAPVWAVAFDPSGGIIATGSKDRTIKLWDVRTGEELGNLEGHMRGVTSLFWSRDGKTIVSASEDPTIRIWDVINRKELAVLRGHAEGIGIAGLVLTPDGKTLVSGSYVRDSDGGIASGEIRFWDMVEKKETRSFQAHAGVIKAMAGSSDGKIVATAGSDRKVFLWDLPEGKKRHTLDHVANLQGLTFSPNGKKLASGTSKSKGEDAVGILKVWDVATGKEEMNIESHEGLIMAIAWSPDGKLLATAGIEGAIKLWKYVPE